MTIRKEKIRNFIDSLLIFIVSGIFAIVAVGYFLKDFMQIITAAFTFALTLTAIVEMLQKKLKPQNDSEVRALLTQLAFSDEKTNLALIKNALNTRYDVKVENDFLLVGTTAVFIYFKYGKLSQGALSNMYIKARSLCKKMIVLTIDSFDAACANLIRTLPDPTIVVLDGGAVYGLLRWLGSLPKIDFELKKSKLSIKEFFSAALMPQRARGYFFTAFVLIFPSLVFSGSLYYIIFAFICILLGLSAKIDIIKRVKKKTDNVDF